MMTQLEKLEARSRADINRRKEYKWERDLNTAVTQPEGTCDKEDIAKKMGVPCLHHHTKGTTTAAHGAHEPRGMVRTGVEGDGNCYFRALSVELTGTQDYHLDIRNNLVHHMKDNCHDFDGYVDGNTMEHIRSMSNSGGDVTTWATEAEIQATADYLEVNVYVWRIWGDSWKWTEFRPRNISRNTAYYITLVCEHQHYQLLRRDGGGCNCLTTPPIACTDNGNKSGSPKTAHGTGCCTRDADAAANVDGDDVDVGNQVHNTPLPGVDSSFGDGDTDHPTQPCVTNVTVEVGGTGVSRCQDEVEAQCAHRGEERVPTTSCGSQAENDSMVINLSDKTISSEQEKLLSYGLKFIPTSSKVNMTLLITDLKEWERRMRLREFFFDQESDDTYLESKYRPKSNFTPRAGRDQWLDHYIEVVTDDIVDNLKRRVNINLSKDEETAMRDLLNDDSIVIRPGDKGSSVVLLNYSDYINTIEKELLDETTYQLVPKSMTAKITRKVTALVNSMYTKGYIDKNMKQYMVPHLPRAGQVQANPKVHKEGAPYRLIINGRGHPTERIAEVAEQELSEHVHSLPSYVQDTTDFLRKLNNMQQPIPADAILFCMDVKGLYPSIPKEEGMLACKEALQSRSDTSIPTDEVLEMIDLVLDNNNFEFNGKQYKQVEGTAIGSRLGMNYACTYMGSWEKQLLKATDDKPHAYWRFVDDVFGVWTHGYAKLTEFWEAANRIHPRVQVTLRHSTDEIEFLDTLVKIRNGNITTSLFEKETDKHMYLHSRSDHPQNVKSSIPYGLAIRAKRICSSDKEYRKERSKIYKRLTSRGHRGQKVQQQLGRVDKQQRQDLLKYKPKTKKNTDRVPIVLTYNRFLPNIHEIVNKRMDILHKSRRMKRVFKQPPLVSYRRERNLKDIMVHGKWTRQTRKPNTRRGCGKNCKICTYTLTDDDIKGATNQNVTVKNSVACNSDNVVYGIHCERCHHIVYVGETGTTLYTRMQNHLSSIKHKRVDQPVALHFNGHGHSIKDFKVVGLEQVRDRNVTYRRLREEHWIAKLKTMEPTGINRQ